MLINKVGVVGCGFMGAGIAQVSAQAGYNVIIRELEQDSLSRGLSTIERYLARNVEKGRISQEDKDATFARIEGTVDMNHLNDCDLLIEVVPEDLDLKKKIFAELDALCPPCTILTSNTSTIRIAEIAKATNRPDKVMGTHFLSPVPPSKLLELVRPPKTSDETVETVKAFGKSIGKEVIIAKDTPEFVFNYLLGALSRAALELLEKGIASKEDIDKSMTLGLGHPIGPIALMDFNGIDVAYLAQKATYEQTRDPRHTPSSLLKKMMDEGKLGRKTGHGFYNYV